MKATKAQIEQAAKIGKEHKVNIVFVNVKNEFFTSENLAALSVKGSKSKYAEIKLSTSSDEEIEEEQTEDQNPE